MTRARLVVTWYTRFGPDNRQPVDTGHPVGKLQPHIGWPEHQSRTGIHKPTSSHATTGTVSDPDSCCSDRAGKNAACRSPICGDRGWEHFWRELPYRHGCWVAERQPESLAHDRALRAVSTTSWSGRNGGTVADLLQPSNGRGAYPLKTCCQVGSCSQAVILLSFGVFL